MNRQEIRRIIQDVNRLDANNVDYEFLKSKYTEIFQGASIITQMAPSTELLFRVRIENNNNLNNISDLKSPPQHLVRGFQRCNSPGNPRFYAASKRLSALKECRIKDGDIFYLSEWMPKTTYPANIMLAGYGKDYPTSISAFEDILYVYVDTLFTRRIHSDFSSDYKHTAAFCEVLMGKCIGGPNEKISPDKTIALKYPSVVDLDGKSHNTVMTPEFADGLLTLNHVMKARFCGSISEQYSIEMLDHAYDFADGIIHWTSDKNRIPTLREKINSIQFIVGRNYKDEKSLFRLTLNEPVNSDYIEKLMNE